jgi:hypothetical protein
LDLRWRKWQEAGEYYTMRSFITCMFYRMVIKSRRMRWAGYVAPVGEMRNAYIILVGKPLAKILFGRPRCRWEDNNRMDLREIGWECLDWIHLAPDRK